MSTSQFRLVALVALVAACTGGGPPDAGPDAETDRARVDGARALALIERQVAFGPRVPGSEGHRAQLDWMLAYLDTLAPQLSADTFEVRTTYGESLTLVNVLARFRPELERRIVVLAHWDTRPTSDREESPEERAEPLPGANDGGSGTGVILELARVLSLQPPPLGVDLLLVDGEDYGPTPDDMFLGAVRYASRIDEGTRPIYGVLLDLVGDTSPLFPMEGYSVSLARPVVQKLWRTAERLGYGRYFPDRVGIPLGDDHLPLNDAGLPTASIVDFEYGPDNAYWHTRDDTLDKLSAATLAMVGEVVAELIYSGG